ncbi:MAG: hypothetical protein Q8K67_07115 [Geothrix sp.]|nr:hypothetical protein [Geothrix sp.]
MNTLVSTVEPRPPYQPTSGFGTEAAFLIERIGGARGVLEYFSVDTSTAYVSISTKKKRRFTLEELLQGATEENMNELHRAIVFNQEGGPVGRELA